MKEQFRPQPENPKQLAPEAEAGPLGLSPPDLEESPHEVDLPTPNSTLEIPSEGQDEPVKPKSLQPHPRLPFLSNAFNCGHLFNHENRPKK
jgi:hypothetical protein